MAIKLSRVIVVPDGKVEFADLDPIYVDAESAESVIAAFKKQGVDLPFDYEHATTTLGDQAQRAPAAGWIKSLVYEKGTGIVASVEWGDQAKKDIDDKSYRYVSPVLSVDKETRKPTALHSAALTNKPRTKNMPELLAAKQSALAGCDLVVASLDYAEPPPIVNAMSEAGFAMSAICRFLKYAGADTSAMSPQEIIEAGAEALESLVDVLESNVMADDTQAVTAKQNGDGELVVQLREVLKLDANADPKLIVSRIEELKLSKVGTVPADEHAKVVARLDAIEKERKTERVEAKLSEWKRTNKVNPNDKEQVDAIREFAERDLDACEKFMARQPAIVASGRVIEPSATSNKPKRDEVIASAVKDWEENGKATAASKVGWVNLELRSHGLQTATEKELAVIG